MAHHPGNVWLPILSLRREDADRLGYNSAKQWQALLAAYAPQMAEAMKIPWDQFHWYAAFHDESRHPHIHRPGYQAGNLFTFLISINWSKCDSSSVYTLTLMPYR